MKLLLENWRKYLNEDQDQMSKLLKMDPKQAVAVITSIDTSDDAALLYDYSDAMEKKYNAAIGTNQEGFWKEKKDKAFDAIDNMSAGDLTEAIKMDLMKQINKDLEKIKRPGVSPEMGMSLAASDPNLERMFAAELEDRKEVILHALDKLITASVEWKGKWNPNHPRAKEMNLMVAELGKSLAGIQRALASRKQVDEVIEKTDGKEQWCLYSKKKGKDGKRKKLGCYRSRSGAKKRERQVQYFKSLEEQ